MIFPLLRNCNYLHAKLEIGLWRLVVPKLVFNPKKGQIFLQFQDVVSQIDFINMGYMLGMLIGSFVFGIISDKLGRKKALLISALYSGLVSLGSSFVSNYWAYFVLRLLLGIGSKGLFMLAFMICVEISGIDYKTYLGILIQVLNIWFQHFHQHFLILILNRYHLHWVKWWLDW